jgi:hypothetical protein
VCCVQVALAAESDAARGPGDCASIESAADRLACFDAAYGRPVEPTAAPAPIVDAPAVDARTVDSSTVVGPAATTAAVAAVVVTPSESEFGRPKSKAELEGESLNSVIAGVGRDAHDKLILELANGQIWRQTENKHFPIKAGQRIEIRHGAMGSYKLYVKDQSRWTRVRRYE